MTIKEIFEAIDGEMVVQKEMNTSDRSKPHWTPDYKEGFLDGLHRAKEVIDELYPPAVES